MTRSQLPQSIAPSAPSAPAIELVAVFVPPENRQHAYGLAHRGREFLYHSDPDGLVRVPAGEELDRFLYAVEGARRA